MSETNPAVPIPTGSALALFGGPGTGKSFLFQAMALRCHSRRFAGALAPMLGRGAVTIEVDGSGSDSAAAIVQEYRSWRKLGSTLLTLPHFFRMRLCYAKGWLGRDTGRLDVQLPDFAGEIYTSGGGAFAAQWRNLATRSPVLVFCLPFWAVFPNPSELSAADRVERQNHLDAYYKVAKKVMRARQEEGSSPALLQLVLTMADDRRCGLQPLREYWLPEENLVPGLLRRLGTLRGLMAYLQDARKVSAYLAQCFKSAAETSALLELLEEGDYPEPWIVPVTAVDRRIVEEVAEGKPAPENPPVPIHVELPLLLTLSDQTKAFV